MRRKFVLTLWILLISGLLLTSLAFIGIERGWIGYMPDMEQSKPYQQICVASIYLRWCTSGYMVAQREPCLR